MTRPSVPTKIGLSGSTEPLKEICHYVFTQADNRVDPFDILVHPARSRMDLFKTRIAGKLSLSEGMKRRSVHEIFGKLDL